jgi:hypothetical protein
MSEIEELQDALKYSDVNPEYSETLVTDVYLERLRKATEALIEIMQIERKEYTCGCGGKSGLCWENSITDEWNNAIDRIHAIVREKMGNGI